MASGFGPNKLYFGMGAGIHVHEEIFYQGCEAGNARVWMQINVVTHIQENSGICWAIRELKSVGAFFAITEEFSHQKTF